MLNSFDNNGKYGLDWEVDIFRLPASDDYEFRFWHPPTRQLMYVRFTRDYVDYCFVRNNMEYILKTIDRTIRIRSLKVRNEATQNRQVEAIRSVLQSLYPRREALGTPVRFPIR